MQDSWYKDPTRVCEHVYPLDGGGFSRVLPSHANNSLSELSQTKRGHSKQPWLIHRIRQTLSNAPKSLCTSLRPGTSCVHAPATSAMVLASLANFGAEAQN